MAAFRLPLPTGWLVPQWPAPEHVRAVFSTRAGGVSNPPFDSLNPALHVGDSATDVMQNRKILRQTLGANPVYMTQVHGTSAVKLTSSNVSDSATSTEWIDQAEVGDAFCQKVQHNAIQADGCWTQFPGAVCSIMVADCLPVLLTNLQGDFVAAAHAGWRGLAGAGSVGILETLVEAVVSQREPRGPDSHDNSLMAWLGPCIGSTKFEVGEEVRTAFVSAHPNAAQMFQPALTLGASKWLADLQGLARQRLVKLGVSAIYGNDGSDPWCTVTHPSIYFSHRRDSLVLGGSGRMLACIWLDQILR